MSRLEVVVHHRNDLPAGLPAVWIADVERDGTTIVNLYLRDDLPQELADCYRVMVTREAFPTVDLDMYAITGTDDGAVVLSPLAFV